MSDFIHIVDFKTYIKIKHLPDDTSICVVLKEDDDTYNRYRCDFSRVPTELIKKYIESKNYIPLYNEARRPIWFSTILSTHARNIFSFVYKTGFEFLNKIPGCTMYTKINNIDISKVKMYDRFYITKKFDNELYESRRIDYEDHVIFEGKRKLGNKNNGT